MKGRALILIFLFLSIFSVAECETGSFSISSSMQETETIDSTYVGSYTHQMWFNDADALSGVKRVINTIPISKWGGSSDESYWANVQYRTGSESGPVVGTGSFGYNKGASVVYAIAFFDDGITATGSSVRIFITTSSGVTFPDRIKTVQTKIGTSGGSTDVFFVMDHLPQEVLLEGTYNVYYGYDFINEYEYYTVGQMRYYNLIRDAGNKSKLIIDDNGSNNLLTETSFKSDNLPFIYQTTENNTWSLTLENDYGDIFYRDITFTTPPEPTGEISLSHTTYVKPDPVIVHLDLENVDYVNYRYYAVIQNYNGSAWVDLTNWDRISSDWESSKVWEYTWTDENLPLTIRGVVNEYDLNTETYDTIAYSESSTYVEPPPDTTGSISTDKTLYDVGDTVIINYTTADSGYVIAQKWPTAMWDMGEYHIWEVISGTGIRTFVIPSSGSGEWRVKLSVNNQDVDTVFFTVNETTSPFLAWHDIDGVLGETQALRFYSDDAAATLKIYDADQIVIYDETVGDGYFDNYAIGTQTNQPPGNWIASLNCSGSYYNDTLTMYAKDAYVSFDADSYTLDQTISINYYLKRSTQTIVLYDANKKDVITWTTTGNYIHLGSGSVDFTLSDDNEYGLDIVADVDANNIKLGLWKVEVLDSGQPIVDNPVYDSAKVSRSIDDPADVSNEMISIFFSPEGIFLLFTAALTMMGLVTVKHPAGGGAGAVVGVGFGVYFNVLPVWMLLLMVIALVVLAGVSVAVHFKGK